MRSSPTIPQTCVRTPMAERLLTTFAEPPGMSFLGDTWEKKKPRWHAVAWALHQPWMADRERGPGIFPELIEIGRARRREADVTRVSHSAGHSMPAITDSVPSSDSRSAA